MPFADFLKSGKFSDFLEFEIEPIYFVEKISNRKVTSGGIIQYLILFNDGYTWWTPRTDIENYEDKTGLKMIDLYEKKYLELNPVSRSGRRGRKATIEPFTINRNELADGSSIAGSGRGSGSRRLGDTPSPHQSRSRSRSRSLSPKTLPARFFREENGEIEFIKGNKSLAEEVVEKNKLLDGDGAYIFREWWFNRVDGRGNVKKLTPKEDLSDEEKKLIRENMARSIKFKFVVTIHRVGKRTEKDENFKDGTKLKSASYEIPGISNSVKPLDITTLDINYSRRFNFPKIFNEKQVENFIKKYNKEIQLVIMGNNPTPELLNYLDRNTEIMWGMLYPTKKSFDLWTEKHSMDIRLLTKHSREYALYLQNSHWSDETAIQESLLMPRSMAASFQEMGKKYGIRKDLVRYVSNGGELIKNTTQKNPYKLLAKGGGVPQIELTNEASHLGSGVHNWAAIHGQVLKAGFSAINASTDLTEYALLQPKLTKEMGEAIATLLDKKAIAREFPVYGKNFKSYSRIDAITRDFSDRKEGLAVWEFKTRWGKINSIKEKAEPDHIKQAVFYSTVLAEMVGEPIKYCYILYAIGEEESFTITYHKYEIKKGALFLL